MTRILIVDDHPIVRQGLATVLADEPDFRVIGEANSGETALREAERLRPDVVVLDFRLPGMSGMDACRELVRRHPNIKIVILTCYSDQGNLTSALGSGAAGFVLKESQPSVYRQAVRTVSSGETFTDPQIAEKLLALATRRRRVKGPFGLSDRELCVLERLPRGMTNREIGHELGITEDTVKTHLRNVLRKMNAKDRAEAAAVAVREGLG